MAQQISVKDLLQVSGASRTVRAYAFLDASLSVRENSANPARDAIDCFLPFVVSGVAVQKATVLDPQKLQKYLRTSFGFDIPLYAIDQFIPVLVERGHLLYSTTAAGHICQSNSTDFVDEQTRILASFDGLEESISDFANAAGLNNPPQSSTWLAALVQFLRAAPEEFSTKVIQVKGVLTTQATQVESALIARFIEYAFKSNAQIFSSILSVFKGIMIEEFVAGAVSASVATRVNDFTVYYDTALLMRILGCSGKLLSEATLELHRYLQDIGVSTQFLSVNEGEVSNIISTLIGRKDYGANIYGETGDAIERGEFSIAQLRMLNGSFVERLATQNIFESRSSINNIHNPQRFQINELAFEGVLQAEAQKREASYGVENRKNDARALSSVMMFRRGQGNRDVLKSKYLFVTSNKLLALASRSFLIKERQLQWSDCPPILHVAQLTTIMWLLKKKRLDDKDVTRDLLANCYAAYQPEPEWLDKFMEAVGRAQEISSSGGDKVLDDSIVLQAARRIAQDQSFGRSAILQKLDIAEILARARQEKQSLAEAERKSGKEIGKAEAAYEIATRQEDSARRISELIISWLERSLLVVAAFVVITELGPFEGFLSGVWSNLALAISAVVSVLSLLDLFGIKLVRPGFDWLRHRLALFILRLLRV